MCIRDRKRGGRNVALRHCRQQLSTNSRQSGCFSGCKRGCCMYRVIYSRHNAFGRCAQSSAFKNLSPAVTVPSTLAEITTAGCRLRQMCASSALNMQRVWQVCVSTYVPCIAPGSLPCWAPLLTMYWTMLCWPEPVVFLFLRTYGCVLAVQSSIHFSLTPLIS